MVVMIIVELAKVCQIEMEIGGQGLGCIFISIAPLCRPRRARGTMRFVAYSYADSTEKNPWKRAGDMDNGQKTDSTDDTVPSQRYVALRLR